MSFTRNRASYFPRPRLRSQTTTSMAAPKTQGCRTSSCSPERVSRTLGSLEGRRAGRRSKRCGCALVRRSHPNRAVSSIWHQFFADFGKVFTPPKKFALDNEAGDAKYAGGFCGTHGSCRVQSGLHLSDNC